MERKHFDKLCKELEELKITQESLGMIRLTTKFRELLIENSDDSKPVNDNISEAIILSVLNVTGELSHDKLADYCCILYGIKKNA